MVTTIGYLLHQAKSSLLERAVLPLVLLLLLVPPTTLNIRGQNSLPAAFDVVHYDAQIEPDIASKSLKGKVRIQVVSGSNMLTTLGLILAN